MMDWYPRYPALWRADTMHLTPYQDGCYMRLVDHYMETRQPLPDSDPALARIIGISLDEWLSHASTMVRAFFRASTSGNLTHKRCDAVLREQDGRSTLRSEIGKKGAEKRWKNQTPDSNCHASAMPKAKQMDATRQDITRQKKILKNTHDADFDEWWAFVPNKVGKDDARKAYQKRRTEGIELGFLLLSAQRWSRWAAAEIGDYTPYSNLHPATWLNKARWNDQEPKERPHGSANGKLQRTRGLDFGAWQDASDKLASADHGAGDDNAGPLLRP